MKNISRNFICFSALFILLFATVPAAHAATYYVATTGSNSSPGTEASPWKTIAHATKRLKEGDTIFVRGGVYNETDYIRISKSNVKLMNAPGESPVIDCDYPVRSHGIFVQSTEKMSIAPDGDITEAPIGNITIEGFEIRNCLTAMRLNSVHDVTIRRNWIHDNDAQGILGDMLRPLIDRNVINHNGGFARCEAGALTKGGTSVCNQMHGLYLTGSDYVITNNLIYDNLASGIHMAGYPWDLSKYNSIIKGRRGATPEYAGANNWLVANNTIAYNHYGPGIIVWQAGAANSKIINNILYENEHKRPSASAQGVGFTVVTGGGHVIENNICHATSPGGLRCIGDKPGKYTATGNMENTLPGFEGAGPMPMAVPNFKLRAGSPAIDKGQNLLPLVTWDHQGIKRPAGAAFDIGAYEFCPTGTVCESGSPPPNPTGGGSFTPGVPVLLGPNGEVCPSGY